MLKMKGSKGRKMAEIKEKSIEYLKIYKLRNIN